MPTSGQLFNLFDYESKATEQLSQMALDYYASGTWDEVTLRDNRAAFEPLLQSPRFQCLYGKADLQ